jgi:hypothetical protein
VKPAIRPEKISRYLFLPEPPDERVPIPDFRTAAATRMERPSPALLDTIYLCQQRQEWYRDYARTEGISPLSYVGSESVENGVEETASKIRAAIGFSLDAQAHAATWTDALRLFIGKADEAGVLTSYLTDTLKKGDILWPRSGP